MLWGQALKLMLDSDMPQLPKRGDHTADDYVATLFVKFLCREPTQPELTTFVTELEEGRASPKMIVRALLTHAEYQNY